MTKLENSFCDKTQKLKHFDKDQKLKLRQNIKSQVATNLNLNCDKTQKLKL